MLAREEARQTVEKAYAKVAEAEAKVAEADAKVAETKAEAEAKVAEAKAEAETKTALSMRLLSQHGMEAEEIAGALGIPLEQVKQAME